MGGKGGCPQVPAVSLYMYRTSEGMGIWEHTIFLPSIYSSSTVERLSNRPIPQKGLSTHTYNTYTFSAPNASPPPKAAFKIKEWHVDSVTSICIKCVINP